MANPTLIEAPGRRRRRRGLRRPPYRLREFAAAYCAAAVATVTSALVEPTLILPGAFFSGIVLTRFISNRVIWWNQANNLENVYRAKLRMLFTWPLSVPALIAKLMIARHL